MDLRRLLTLQSPLNQMTVETTSEKEKSFLFLFLKKDNPVFGKVFFDHFYKARQNNFPEFMRTKRPVLLS